MIKPKVTVCVLTYNHEKYIRECIDGILLQKTTFPIEIIIHDDNSTDNTKNIIDEYYKNNKDIITPILRTENLLSQGINPIPSVFEMSNGEYIAYIEGDDYWIDENKLQKQADFLDNNSDYSLCCHNFNVIKENENFEKLHKWNEEHFSLNKYKDYRDVELFNLFNPFILKFMTLMFRKSAMDLKEFKKSKRFYDLFCIATLLKNAKGACLNDIMAVYRMHSCGVWTPKAELEKIKIRAFIYYDISKYYKHKKVYFRELAKTNLKVLYKMIKKNNQYKISLLFEIFSYRIELFFYKCF